MGNLQAASYGVQSSSTPIGKVSTGLPTTITALTMAFSVLMQSTGTTAPICTDF